MMSVLKVSCGVWTAGIDRHDSVRCLRATAGNTLTRALKDRSGSAFPPKPALEKVSPPLLSSPLSPPPLAVLVVVFILVLHYHILICVEPTVS